MGIKKKKLFGLSLCTCLDIVLAYASNMRYVLRGQGSRPTAPNVEDIRIIAGFVMVTTFLFRVLAVGVLLALLCWGSRFTTLRDVCGAFKVQIEYDKSVMIALKAAILPADVAEPDIATLDPPEADVNTSFPGPVERLFGFADWPATANDT